MPDQDQRAGGSRTKAALVLKGALIVLVAAAALLWIGCCCTVPEATRPVAARTAQEQPSDTLALEKPPLPPADSVTLVEMQDVHFRIDRELALGIDWLRGEMVPQDGEVVNFDDPGSFLIRIDAAEVGLTAENLTYLLNTYVFGYTGAPLRNLQVRMQEDRITMEGILHKVVDIPFEMTAAVEATPEGLIRLHPTAMQICGIPGKGLLEALGLQLDELMDLTRAEGVRVVGNDLLLDPEQLLPPPAIEGNVTGVRVAGNRLVQIFGTPGDTARQILEIPTPPDPDAENYMFYRGGVLKFGKLYMVRADLQIIDADPSDPFDFFLDQYKSQLVAGYSRIMPDLGLKTFMPDYRQVGPEVEEGEKITPEGTQ